MIVQVNWLAVLLAALSSMVVGAIWYAPSVFGAEWTKLTGIKMDKKSRSKDMNMKLVTVFVASFVTAFILAHVTYITHFYFNHTYLQDAVMTSMWLWLGFTATRMYVHSTFEGQRKKLLAINALHELTTIVVMALIIGLLKP